MIVKAKPYLGKCEHSTKNKRKMRRIKGREIEKRKKEEKVGVKCVVCRQ
jgi:hypothetical protein